MFMPSQELSEERLRHEQRVEHVKKEELARLEKHSEPLRLYLMKFVVPALTGALVDVCREQPEDPVGYLAEYLSLYSEVSAERRAARAAEGKS
ncbi:Ak7 [Symbiodinium natans]|uniref:Ak7 protein n=1 Tax=Symbiodinium natans TaxID=878477 RepID=A0A812NE46_9DINO|nr:Ak7 [Symbiodinium natans]